MLLLKQQLRALNEVDDVKIWHVIISKLYRSSQNLSLYCRKYPPPCFRKWIEVLNTQSFGAFVRSILARLRLTLSWELAASFIQYVVHITEYFKDVKLLKRCLSVRTCRMKGHMYIDGPFRVESWEKYQCFWLSGLEVNISGIMNPHYWGNDHLRRTKFT
jgi:hypothetical protein